MYYKQISSCSSLRSSITFPLLCLCIFPILRIVGSSEESTNPSVFQRFWEIGCEFSGVVTRVRRSASPIPDEEPNFEDPEELFKYLYPLADRKPGEEEEGNVGGQRSHDTHSLSSWLEDLMGLWHSECHNHRRNKRSAKRMVPMGGRRDGVRRKPQAKATPSHRYNYMASSSGRNSSLAISSRRQGTTITDDGAVGAGYQNEEKENMNKEEDEEKESTNEEDEEQDDSDADEGEDEESSSEEPAAPKIADAPEKEDIFFTQYGGDIEYFFPLLSFGIPFDGEITLLGFHGFRGLFPY